LLSLAAARVVPIVVVMARREEERVEKNERQYKGGIGSLLEANDVRKRAVSSGDEEGKRTRRGCSDPSWRSLHRRRFQQRPL
jgi:hypothetical protein